MCFSENVSIGTYMIGIAGTINLFSMNYVAEAFFYFIIIQMQLIEYVLWKNQTCNDVNKKTTKIGVIVNHFEPIALWIGISVLANKELPSYVHGIMGIYVLASIYVTKTVLNEQDPNKKIECTLKTPSSGGHLYWQWNEQPYTYIFYVFFLLCISLLSINGLKNGTIHALILIGSFFGSLLIYRKTHSVGAMWCFFGAFAPWIISYINKD